jgi:two-component system KDP operon response regulator KdpE
MLSYSLTQHGFATQTAADGRTAKRLLMQSTNDLIILDLGLPDMDGIALIEWVRRTSDKPLIVLSARRTQDDKVLALDAGADDYLTKPFGIDELCARIRVAERRIKQKRLALSFSDEHLRIDTQSRQATVSGHAVHFTPTEWSIVEALLTQRGQIISPKELTEAVWQSSNMDRTRSLRVHIAAIRHKIESDSSYPIYIQTITGQGYQFSK